MISKLLLLACAAVPGLAFDYGITEIGSMILTDVATEISPVFTLFVDQGVIVEVTELAWEGKENPADSDDLVFYKTMVDGVQQASGSVSLNETGRELPSSIEVGTVKVDKGGRYTIEVVLTLDGEEVSTSMELEAYGSGVSVFPLVVILLLAMVTGMVSNCRSQISFEELSI